MIAPEPAGPGPLHALDPASRARMMSRIYAGLSAEDMLREALTGDLKGRVALVSSFGAESAALLHMVAEIDRATPVIFLETGMLFAETLDYQRRLAADLGLKDLRILRPDADALAAGDPDGALHARDPDACCTLRKVAPLAAGLKGFDGWITGRKRYQGGARAALPLFETDEAGRLKLNPLADWDPARVRDYMRAHRLPPHPLVAKGFPSIGCAPCTTPVAEGEDPRAGRWRGEAKTECGIHFVDGKLVRGPAPQAEAPSPA
ncbi:MAG: phosphoadenylyl-sulfate reductase [Pseudomonadota bacterium]